MPLPVASRGRAGSTISMGDRMTLAYRFRNPLAFTMFGIGALCSAISAAEADAYIQTNLVSNIDGLAAFTDLTLINPWGISFGPTTPVWVSKQGANATSLYTISGGGVTPGPTFTIPTTGSGPQGPTGQVTNLIPPPNTPAASFFVNNIASRFIFANLNGTISAWNGQGTSAIIQATTPGRSTPVLPSITLIPGCTPPTTPGLGASTCSISSFAPVSLGAGAFANPFPGARPVQCART